MPIPPPALLDLWETARAACLASLGEGTLGTIAPRIPCSPECFEQFARHGAAFAERCSAQLQTEGWSDADVSRALLVQAALQTLERLPSQPVSDPVKRLLLEDIRNYADPPTRWLPLFAPGGVRYREMVKLVTFQRFPAGQLHWEVVPRFPGSFVRDAGFRGGFRLAGCLARLGGRGPLWETHLNDRRPNAFLLSEKASAKSYHRMARSMELQPRVRGILVCSWLYSIEAATVSPHLAWLRRFFVENGATVADLGLAPADSGFLTGDAQRRALYESGAFRPRITVALWPRSAVLAWAQRNASLGDEAAA